MASLPLLHEWANILKQNKWAFVSYTGMTYHKNCSRWYRVNPATWSVLRYQLETFGADEVEQEALAIKMNKYDTKPPKTTVVRGYMAHKIQREISRDTHIPEALRKYLGEQNGSLLDGPSELLPAQELKSTDFVFPNTFVWIVRVPMPTGGKPFVPLEQMSRYIHIASYANSNDERLAQMKQDNAHKFHALDRAVGSHDIVYRTPEGLESRCTYQYMIPSAETSCSGCRKIGHHMPDVCWLWPIEVKRLEFGAQKLRKAQNVSESDATMYALVHKRNETNVLKRQQREIV